MLFEVEAQLVICGEAPQVYEVLEVLADVGQWHADDGALRQVLHAWRRLARVEQVFSGVAELLSLGDARECGAKYNWSPLEHDLVLDANVTRLDLLLTNLTEEFITDNGFRGA